jgi:hypothetical protein
MDAVLLAKFCNLETKRAMPQVQRLFPDFGKKNRL